MAEVGLGFGSNLGDKAANILESVRRLLETGAVHDLRMSSLYRTAPWGNTEQDWFVNACGIGASDLQPLDLLACCNRVEVQMGRERRLRWGPRIIDVDILYLEGVVLDAPQLTLPHVEMLNRAFVLVPLAELNPGLVIRGVRIDAALTRLDAVGIVRLGTPESGPPKMNTP